MNHKKIDESGRSMVEMLGVLSIVGALSVMMLYGFKYAIFRYRVHQTLTQISTMVAGAKTIDLDRLSDDEIIEEDGRLYIPVKHVISNVNFKEDDDYHIVTPLNAEVAIYQDVNGLWRTEIEYTDYMDFGDCRALIFSPVAENGIAWNNVVYTQQQLKDDEEAKKNSKDPSIVKTICDDLTQKTI